jgi:hypothetical protein
MLAHSGLHGAWLRAVAALALGATLIGRAVAPALPGSMTGIERWIVASEESAAFLSQLFVVAGALVVVRLLITILRDSRIAVSFRLGVAPGGAAVLTLVMASARGPIDANWTLGLGLLAAGLAAAATPLALRRPHTRGAGLILGICATAALVHVGSRLVAVQASVHAWPLVFAAARIVATLALLLDVAALVVAGLWLAQRRWRLASGVATVVLAVAAVASWGALMGSHYEASTWQVLAARTLAELVRHPVPAVAPVVRYGVELATLGATVAVLLSRSRESAQVALVALVLLAHTATDIPVLGLAVTLAALIAPLAAAMPAEPEPAALDLEL